MTKVLLTAAAMFISATMLTGCDNQEDVLEIETPGGSINVETDRDTGAVDVKVDEK